jgi:hypothetical protein
MSIRGRGEETRIQSLTGLRFYYAAAFVLWAHTVTAFLIPAGVPILGSAPAVGFLGMTLFFCAERFLNRWSGVQISHPAPIKSSSYVIYLIFRVSRVLRIIPNAFNGCQSVAAAPCT